MGLLPSRAVPETLVQGNRGLQPGFPDFQHFLQWIASAPHHTVPSASAPPRVLDPSLNMMPHMHCSSCTDYPKRQCNVLSRAYACGAPVPRLSRQAHGGPS